MTSQSSYVQNRDDEENHFKVNEGKAESYHESRRLTADLSLAVIEGSDGVVSSKC